MPAPKLPAIGLPVPTIPRVPGTSRRRHIADRGQLVLNPPSEGQGESEAMSRTLMRAKVWVRPRARSREGEYMGKKCKT